MTSEMIDEVALSVLDGQIAFLGRTSDGTRMAQARAHIAARLVAADRLAEAANNVLSQPELSEIASLGSMSPCEDALGQMYEALATYKEPQP